MLQNLNYTENPVDIPNPDRGPYRGRWQNIPPEYVTEGNSPCGITPEVDHRVPVDENSILYHGRQVPPVEGDDIEETQFYNGINQNDKLYIGGTGISALPSISFMGFDLVNFSSNAFLSAKDAFAYQDDGLFYDPDTNAPRTGKTGPLTVFALDYIRGLMQKVREGNGVAFVKFSYDGNGFNYIEPFKYPHLDLTQGLIHGPEPTYITSNNPSDKCDIPGHTEKNWIEYHIWQLSPILHEFEDIIMCVKTGMLGPWGEQHSSPLARDPAAYISLLNAYLEAVPASRSLLTHAGGFLAWYNARYGTSYTFFDIDTMPIPKRGTPEARFGFYNDSYVAGSEDLSDNGSLSEGGGMLRPGAEPDALLSSHETDVYGYDRYRIISWINKQNNFMQGEGGIGDNIFGNMPGAITEACNLRTTALNMRHGMYNRWSEFIYNEENVTTPVTFPLDATEEKSPFTGETRQAFFDPVYDGKNGLEYIRDRMGYRLVLRESHLNEYVESTGGTLTFKGKIQNVGFGNVINKKRVSILLRQKDETHYYIALTDLDARDWLTAENGNNRPDNTNAWREISTEIKIEDFCETSSGKKALPGEKPPPGEYEVYLKINDPKETSENKRCIKLANHDIWNATLGANLIGTTVVL